MCVTLPPTHHPTPANVALRPTPTPPPAPMARPHRPVTPPRARGRVRPPQPEPAGPLISNKYESLDSGTGTKTQSLESGHKYSASNPASGSWKSPCVGGGAVPARPAAVRVRGLLRDRIDATLETPPGKPPGTRKPRLPADDWKSPRHCLIASGVGPGTPC